MWARGVERPLAWRNLSTLSKRLACVNNYVPAGWGREDVSPFPTAGQNTKHAICLCNKQTRTDYLQKQTEQLKSQ